LIYKELQTNLAGVEFPREDNKDLTGIIVGKSIPQVDTCALYSASQRANKGRKRHKHSGLTASIYMSDKLGGEQKGILVQTISWKKGPVIYQSIPDNRGETLRPMLDKYIPKNVPLFSDEGYKFYYRINKNHRMINHSLKSKDRRYKFSRERWSKNGIHTQCVEGHNRNLKYNFGSGYGYIRPKWSQMYLDEYAFWRNVKYYGWEALVDDGLGPGQVVRPGHGREAGLVKGGVGASQVVRQGHGLIPSRARGRNGGASTSKVVRQGLGLIPSRAQGRNGGAGASQVVRQDNGLIPSRTQGRNGGASTSKVVRQDNGLIPSRARGRNGGAGGGELRKYSSQTTSRGEAASVCSVRTSYLTIPPSPAAQTIQKPKTSNRQNHPHHPSRKLPQPPLPQDLPYLQHTINETHQHPQLRNPLQ
jgi:hypothetical protein